MTEKKEGKQNKKKIQKQTYKTETDAMTDEKKAKTTDKEKGLLTGRSARLMSPGYIHDPIFWI
jgi:hypothetical protein